MRLIIKLLSVAVFALSFSNTTAYSAKKKSLKSVSLPQLVRQTQKQVNIPGFSQIGVRLAWWGPC